MEICTFLVQERGLRDVSVMSPWSLLARLAVLTFLLSLGVVPARAQDAVVEIPPPPGQETAPPTRVEMTLAEPRPPAPTPPPGQVYQWNPSAPNSDYAYGRPIGPVTPRGDSLEDRAQAGEILDLMLTSGGYGMLIANGIVNWGGIDSRSGPDLVSVRFGATFLGATLSLTGLLTMDSPRGVPTVMAIGLRYGAAAGGLLTGAVGGSGNDALGAMVIGGALGYGLGAGLGFGLRPHVSRSRFVEAGVFWGTTLGFLIAGAARTEAQGTWGLGLGGMAAGILSHSLVASLTRVSVGRGWLLNAGFVAPAGLAAFAYGVFSSGRVEQDVVFGLAIGFGLLGLGIVFAVSDGIQDPGWVEDNEVLASLQLGFAPSADGQGGTVSVSGAF